MYALYVYACTAACCGSRGSGAPYTPWLVHESWPAKVLKLEAMSGMAYQAMESLIIP